MRKHRINTNTKYRSIKNRRRRLHQALNKKNKPSSTKNILSLEKIFIKSRLSFNLDLRGIGQISELIT